ncbi:MAG TPA: hypothetical protein VGW74_07060 [Propionibacteriaceae bacterium]|nr:hypothetical protein [Propionibacteriaceae bacterium]
MALAKDLSHLPAPAKVREDGMAPDPEPTFLAPYFDHLLAQNEAEGKRPHAVEGTRFRHSMAGNCSRAVAYYVLGVEESNPMDLPGVFVTGTGTQRHDEIQAVLVREVDGLTVEVPCRVEGFDGSGNADGLHVVDGKRICWEHKNVGGFVFKMAIGERSAPQGPKHDHIVQAGLNALALDADTVVITYLAWEAVSVQAAARKRIAVPSRIAAQWTIEREVWEPLAHAEVRRIKAILAMVDDGTLPARKIPDPELPKGAVIVDPSSARWEQHNADGEVIDTGTTWNCFYCRWQSMCPNTPAGRAPVEVLVDLGVMKAVA